VTSEDLERTVNTIIGCAIEVHRHLGPGLLESVYRECLLIELRHNSCPVESELRVPVIYKGHRANSTLILDLLVSGCVVLELKAIEQIHAIHLAQVITYLKLSNYPVGLLMNFNVTSLRSGLRRLDHPDRYKQRSLEPPTP
jgi:GxxExxY protein